MRVRAWRCRGWPGCGLMRCVRERRLTVLVAVFWVVVVAELAGIRPHATRSQRICCQCYDWGPRAVAVPVCADIAGCRWLHASCCSIVLAACGLQCHRPSSRLHGCSTSRWLRLSAGHLRLRFGCAHRRASGWRPASAAAAPSSSCPLVVTGYLRAEKNTQKGGARL